MNIAKKLVIAAVTLFSAVSVTSAFALSQQSPLTQDNAPTTQKTRAQVQAELVQAEEAGVVPASPQDYPNIDASVKKANQYSFASAERWWSGNANTNVQ
ncbi:MAG: DUF4148 domain-containing protein [Pararobbsia sp.]